MLRRLAPGAMLLATACMTAPAPPPAIAPAGAAGAFAALPTVSIAPVPDDWWRLYDDPRLDRLIAASLAANADLRIALANVDAARAAQRQARAARLPQTMIESSAATDDPSAQPSASNLPSTDYDVAATVSWDVDLFGRLRSGALAARADAGAAEGARDAVRVAVVADTVLAYVDLCGAVRGATAAQTIVAAQERSVSLVREQLRAGEVSPLELAQATGLLETVRAALPGFAGARANALYRLATLQGLPPAAARGWSFACNEPPRLAGALPAGDGTALLLRRPDIREAEHRLAAAAARIGVARADLYPRVNLGGAIGLLAGGFSASATPLIAWSFPNQGPARARLSQARAAERAALAQWDAAVLRALRETETALAAQDAEARRNAALAAAVRDAELYRRRAAARVRLGDAAFLLQIDAERALAAAILQQAQSDLLLAQAQVATFRALGGGWRSGPVASGAATE